MPPYLAGRTSEQERFRELLQQSTITENLVLTGLRGVGKTVLLESLKPIARSEGWLWTGADMSESAGITEERLATRLITDISVMTSPLLRSSASRNPLGFGGSHENGCFGGSGGGSSEGAGTLGEVESGTFGS